MGAGASSHVREIRIDQNDENWNRSGSGRGIRSAPSNALGAVGKRLKRSAGSRSQGRREEQLTGALEAAEKRASESQTRVRQLERELATLERRNQDLSDEVTWLKQQLTERPEIPVPPRPTTSGSRPGTSGGPKTGQKHEVDAVSVDPSLKSHNKKLEDELHNMHSKMRRESQKLEAQLEDTRHELNEQLMTTEAKLYYSTKLNEQYEAVIKANLSESAVDKAKSAADKAVNSQKRHRIKEMKNAVQQPANQRSQQTQNEQTDTQKLRIRKLEDEIVRRDIEIAHLKNFSKSQPADSDSLEKRGSISSSRPPSSSSHQSFQAVKKLSNPAQQPMKVERKVSGKVEDEIDALLKSSAHETTTDESSALRDQFAASTRSLPPLPSRNLSHTVPHFSQIEEAEPGMNKENLRAISVAGMKTSPRVTPDPRITEAPRKWTRPQTAGVTLRQMAVAEIHTPSITSAAAALKDSQRRGGSAPMLCKPLEEDQEQSFDFSSNNAKKKKKPSDDAEIMSISDMDDFDAIPLEREASTVSDTGTEVLVPKENDPARPPSTAPIRPSSANIRSRPPSSLNRFRGQLPSRTVKTGSASSLYSSGAGTGEEENDTSDDEEVKRILEMRQAGGQVRPRTGQAQQRQAPPSAKSRDSGFLGDSYPNSGALWRAKERTESVEVEEKSEEDF